MLRLLCDAAGHAARRTIGKYLQSYREFGVMRVKLCSASIAAVLAIAALIFAPADATAKPLGAGWGAPGKIKPWHFAKPWARHHRRAFRSAPFAGFAAGYWPPFDPAYNLGVIVDGPRSQRLDPYLPPAASLTCQRSREIVTVPSETGGERQIVVTRC
jgi:hypothetical protein